MQLSPDGSVLTLTAPDPVTPGPPIAVRNVGVMSLIAASSTASDIGLRGLAGAGGVKAQVDVDTGLTVGLNSETTAVSKTTPPTSLQSALKPAPRNWLLQLLMALRAGALLIPLHSCGCRQLPPPTLWL